MAIALIPAIGQLVQSGAPLLDQVESWWVSVAELDRKLEKKLFQ